LNTIANEVRLIGTLVNVSVTDRRLWAMLATAGHYSEYVPILIFAAKDEDGSGFGARVAALAEGAKVVVQGRLSVSREFDEHQQPVLHPRTGHPLRRTEIIVLSFATLGELVATPTPRAPTPPAPASRPVAGPVPPALAQRATAPAQPARTFPIQHTGGNRFGTPVVPWA
jgi:hypothetical protein